MCAIHIYVQVWTTYLWSSTFSMEVKESWHLLTKLSSIRNRLETSSSPIRMVMSSPMSDKSSPAVKCLPLAEITTVLQSPSVLMPLKHSDISLVSRTLPISLMHVEKLRIIEHLQNVEFMAFSFLGRLSCTW